MVERALSRETSPGSSTDYGFAVINNTNGSISDDGWDVMSAFGHEPQHFFIGGVDSPRDSDLGSDHDAVSSKNAEEACTNMSASGTGCTDLDADMAVSMILRDSDRQVVQQHVELVRKEAEANATKVTSLEEELAVEYEKVSQLKVELAQLHEGNAKISQAALQQDQASKTAAELLEVQGLQDKVLDKKKLVIRSTEVLQLQKELAMLRAEMVKHQEEAKAATSRAEEEAARAAEAESIMVAMNIEAESLNKDLATAAEANASLRGKLNAASAVSDAWSWNALEGVWMSEPGKEIQWIDSASGGVWSKDGQWAKIVEYAGGFALLPDSESTCRGELVQSVRGSILLWPGKGAWVKQSESSVHDAFEAGSHQLRCPANHVLRWACSSSVNSCKPVSASTKSKRWDMANHMLSVCSACSFPVGSTEVGMWQCKGCRYNVCGSCVVASAPVGLQAKYVYPSEVKPYQSFTCNGCNITCGSGKSVIGRSLNGQDHYLCLSCLSVFLMQN
jgi:hypothetical protein